MSRRSPKRTSALLFLALLLSALILLSAPVWARVGGGHSFSGGHSSGGYGGGGGFGGGYGGGGTYYSSNGGAGAYFLVDAIVRMFGAIVRLTFVRPLIGIPLDILLGYIAWKIFSAWNHPGYDITNESGGNDTLVRSARIAVAKGHLNQLRAQQDPNFSRIALMDFLNALYSTLHHARGASARLQAYSGYLSPAAVESLKNLGPGVREVKGVIVGSANVVDVSAIQADQPTRITVEFEANYTEDLVTGSSQSWYASETWVLSRGAQVLSREPANIRQIACPACGAPANADAGGRCPACGNVVRAGDFNWFVESITSSREKRPPLLTSDVAEEGNELPTLVDPHFNSEKALFEAQTPAFKWDAFSQRASFIFTQLQKAWTERKWEVVRPYESDSIFESHSYWIQEYKRQKLVNVLGNIQIQRMVPVKIEQDKFYSAITLRIYAAMIDCTRSEDGKLVSGSATRPRAFTEYWTFIRGKSAQPPKPGSGPLNCPACGAPLKINMAGTCEYCHAKITSGDFDWVLSSIEQDEAYSG